MKCMPPTQTNCTTDARDPLRRPRGSEVEMSRWGKDHWSTFAFVARCCADGGARGFDIPHRRPAFAHIRWDQNVPTILRGGEKLYDHDDWDCLDDAQAAGLLLICGTGASWCLSIIASDVSPSYGGLPVRR